MVSGERPQVVITSRNSARISLIIVCLFFILSVGLLYLVFQYPTDDIDRYFYVIHFILILLIALINFVFFLSYSKPNLFLFSDRLTVHNFNIKGEIPRSNVAYLVTGYNLLLEQIPKNQVRCINNSFTMKNKILMILKRPTLFTLPFGRTKNVSEIVIDVQDVGRFVWNMIMRNPEIEVFHMPYNAMVYKRGVFTFEPVVQV